jgi:hypothetical protein
MAATLRLVHKALGVEVRRGTYDVVLDGERVGLSTTFLSPESVELRVVVLGGCDVGERQPIRSARDTMIPSGPRT